MNLDRVQVTAGTVTGTNHTLPGKPVWKNNQDAFFLLDDQTGVPGGTIQRSVRTWGPVLQRDSSRWKCGASEHGSEDPNRWTP